jgi:hypothetical protein
MKHLKDTPSGSRIAPQDAQRLGPSPGKTKRFEQTDLFAPIIAKILSRGYLERKTVDLIDHPFFSKPGRLSLDSPNQYPGRQTPLGKETE